MTPGGWKSIAYTFATGRRVGMLKLVRAMLTRNACKTCALGMGGQKGGMRNEAGHFPEFCKKSLQAMAADMAGALGPEFFSTYSIKQLKSFSPRELQTAGRLSRPLYAEAGDSHYREISWDEAIEKIILKLKSMPPRESFFYFSGRSSNEAAFALQLLARQSGTNHINNCSYYCHQASGVGMGDSIGTGTATIDLDSLEQADCFFLIGGNPSSNHPRLMTALMRLRRRGGQVVVINPVREPGLVRFSVPSDPRSLFFGSSIASCYVQPHIGGDIALMTGIAKVLLEAGAVDLQYIAQYTEGFSELESLAKQTSWDSIIEQSGVSEAKIREVSLIYSKSKKTIFGWTMGITHHVHGADNVQWIANLALLRGMVGRPGAGLLPIRGHSNVQGIGTIGVTPQLKKSIYDRFVAAGIPVPDHQGFDTMKCIEAAHRGQMRFAFCLGGNLYGSNPEPTFAAHALNSLDQIVYLSTHLNTGHAHGTGKETIILPVRARDEEEQVTTQESMFNYVRFSDGGPSRIPGARSEVSIVASLGQKLFGLDSPIDWRGLEQHKNIRKMISLLVPELSELEQSESKKMELEIPGRIKLEPKFATLSGKAKIASIPLPKRAIDRSRYLNLMTIRSEGQFNTVVFEDEDVFRGMERRDVLLMNDLDMERLKLKVDQEVTVRSSVGKMSGIRVRSFDVRQGNVMMYCPEANVLISRTVDPRSFTPSFKSELVEVFAGLV